jgi:hypothetical protein
LNRLLQAVAEVMIFTTDGGRRSAVCGLPTFDCGILGL